jgi:hypothetical protein
MIHGVDADDELARDLLVPCAARQQLQDLDLPLRQPSG